MAQLNAEPVTLKLYIRLCVSELTPKQLDFFYQNVILFFNAVDH